MRRVILGSGILSFVVVVPIAIGLLDEVTVQAQTVSPTLRFEVASVKPAEPEGSGPRTSGIPGPNNTDPGRFTARTRLLSLITIAYDIPIYQVSDPNDSLMPMVDIEAKMPVDTTREQFNVMLQNLLADRLSLKVHWSSKEIDGYALTLAKGGPKFKPSAPDSSKAGDEASKDGEPPRVVPNGFPIPPPGNGPWVGVAPVGKMVMRGHNETVAQMAGAIQLRTLPGPLTDATGLTGKYDYTIFWSVQATTAARVVTSADDPDAQGTPDGPSIYDAVEEQLGLVRVKSR
jgi:uncharacterized protein (TIGR03435 family)